MKTVRHIKPPNTDAYDETLRDGYLVVIDINAIPSNPPVCPTSPVFAHLWLSLDPPIPSKATPIPAHCYEFFLANRKLLGCLGRICCTSV